MVYITRTFLDAKKSSPVWIDSLRVYVRGGHGGTGLPRVHGVGGAGGSVYVQADSKLKDLATVRRNNQKQRYVAEAGENSV